MSSFTEPPQEWVHYTEQRGNLSRLQALAQEWAALPSCLSAEVLYSPDQVGEQGQLYLLVTRWREAVPPLTLPAGVKGWSFAVLSRQPSPA